MEEAGAVLLDASKQLWDRLLVVWAPILGLAEDLKTLAHGFNGLGGRFREFAGVGQEPEGRIRP